MYKLIRPLLFKLDPETAHHLVLSLGGFFSAAGPLFAYEHESLESEVFGLKFKNPVGLAAGFDKNGTVAGRISALGFGFVESGTVVPQAQPGNPKPRLFRKVKDLAIANRMGFNSLGMAQTAVNLKNLVKRNFILGINLGKNKITPNEQAVNDYVSGYETLAPFADYVVVNVSSPNTPGLRELQDKEPLKNLLMKLQEREIASPNPSSRGGEREEVVRSIPLLLKISPDLTNEQMDDVVEVALETKIAGLIATNTIATTDGGLSGLPLRGRATRVASYLYKKLNGSLPIIGVGGIFSAEDAYEKIRAGASLVQIYTGMIYEGPGVVKKIKKGLVELLKQDGFTNISQAVGAAHR